MRRQPGASVNLDKRIPFHSNINATSRGSLNGFWTSWMFMPEKTRQRYRDILKADLARTKVEIDYDG